MKKLLFFLTALVLAGCTVSEIGEGAVVLRSNGVVYTAGFEDVDTKVYVDADLKTHWTADDRISIFTSTYNEEYRFDGQTGDTEGSFTVVDDKFHTGASVPTTYAVYPYFEETSISTEGVITLNLPAVQNYAENSYGLGANTMVAATESKSSKSLNFKSLCGYVVVRLYGEGTVKSITLTGNNGEKIAGQATVNATYGQAPMVTMSEFATTSITVDCGEGVVLGRTAEDATAFWFAVPPVTFSQGFTIRVTNTDLWSMEKAMNVERTVVRNVKNPLSLLEVIFNIPREGNIEFEDANFKAYCVENFDTNGDGEISYEEAAKAPEIKCDNLGIHSLRGIQYFKSLTKLSCSHNHLATLDVSANNKLEILYCYYNELNDLKIGNNQLLTQLFCQVNSISSIDISDAPSLSFLDCSSNNLTSLDITHNTKLLSLYCNNNGLTTLEVSNNPLLGVLRCRKNHLSNLDISHNTCLLELFCENNSLTALDISAATQLYRLECASNELSSIIIGENASLSRLNCSSNKLSALDVSKASSLSSLNCSYNSISDFILPDNQESLSSLNCSNNLLSSLSITSGGYIESVNCSDNKLSVFECNSIIYFSLDCSNNQLKALQTKTWYHIKTLKCNNNQIESLDLRPLSALKILNCDSNKLQELNVSKNSQLDSLSCNDNCIMELDIQSNPNLLSLSCNHNYLQLIHVQNYALQYLDCSDNQLSSLEVGANPSLLKLNCRSNNLSSIDVSSNLSLSSFYCNNNPNLFEICLKTGQTILDFQYDTEVATIYYK